ncbi:MAG: amidohydrolase family protein [Erysipelotrichaceae bacterium]|jgi:imidazolonepropionase-like amidohydrolase|nr:amidohydrolase family protein [Erysipelotrichaceae bacterium]
MLLIQNGTVYLGKGEHKENWDVLLNGDRIEAIGPKLDAPKAKVIDASGKHVYPGLVLGLCSVGAVAFSEMGSWDNNEAAKPVAPEMDIRYAFDLRELKLQRFGRVGITSYGLCPGTKALVAGQISLIHVDGKRSSDVFIKEKIALKGNFTSTVKQTFKAKGTLETRMAMYQILDDTFRGAKEYLEKETKDYDEGKEVLCRVLRKEIPFIVAADTQSEIEAVKRIAKKYGFVPVISGAYEIGDCADEIIKAGWPVMLGDASFMLAGLKAKIDHSKLVKLYRKGLKLSIFCSGDQGYPPAYEQLLWVAAEMSAAGASGDEIMDMMTINPAKALGVDDLVGSLQVGKLADLFIACGNPAERFDNFVETTIVNGKVFYTREK